MTTTERIITVLFVVAIIISVFASVQAFRLIKSTESCKMFYETKYNADTVYGVNGLYYPSEDYYCVWVKDRKLSDIQDTDYHEMCHSNVEKSYKHFCEGALYG